MKYNVRCCCDGNKILGTLYLRRGDYRDGESELVAIKPNEDAKSFWVVDNVATSVQSRETVSLRRFRNFSDGTDEIAVYSDDRSMDFWRTIVGFEENPGYV